MAMDARIDGKGKGKVGAGLRRRSSGGLGGFGWSSWSREQGTLGALRNYRGARKGGGESNNDGDRRRRRRRE